MAVERLNKSHSSKLQNEKAEGYEHTPLLNPLYEKLEEIKEDLLLGNCPEFSEGVQAASLYIDINYLNSGSTSDRIDSVKNLIKYINEGSLSEHLSDNDVKSAIRILTTFCLSKNRIGTDEFTKCLVALSKTKPNLTFEIGNSYTRFGDGPELRSFYILPGICFRFVTPEHICICSEVYDHNTKDWKYPVSSILSVPYKESVEKEFLSPDEVQLFFNQLVPDWVHFGNDLIMYIESKETMTPDPYLSDVGVAEFHKYNVNDEESRIKQTDERDVFLKWLRNPEITALTCMYPYKEKKALENCFKSIINRLGWQFKDLKPDDLQDSLAVLARKGNLQYGEDELIFNNEPLYMQRTNENKIEFIADDKVVCVTKFKQPLLMENSSSESSEISLNGVTIDSSKFCKNVFHQSVRYKWDSRKKRKENEHIDIMLGDDLSKKDAIRLAFHFMQQYVKPDEVLNLKKDKTELDYGTDCHHFLKIKDKGTLVELFSRLAENSNFVSDENIGRINIDCKGNSLMLWFHNYSEGYNYSKVFNFSSEKNLFPDVSIEVRDKRQCSLDKKERMYAEKKKGYTW